MTDLEQLGRDLQRLERFEHLSSDLVTQLLLGLVLDLLLDFLVDFRMSFLASLRFHSKDFTVALAKGSLGLRSRDSKNGSAITGDFILALVELLLNFVFELRLRLKSLLDEFGWVSLVC